MNESLQNFFLGMGVTSSVILFIFLSWKAFSKAVMRVTTKRFCSMQDQIWKIDLRTGGNSASVELFRGDLSTLKSERSNIKKKANRK